MLDKRFPITESQDIVVNLTFSTTVLTDGSGGEERNINWQSPLLSFDLQQVLVRRSQIDEIVNFFKEARGAATVFKYRDWSDYRVTPEPKDTKYGSSTVGVLFPPPDGERTEFGLVKRYIVPNCVHLRGILLPDPATVTIYDTNLNPVPSTNWVFDSGKFIFTTPPVAGQLLVEAEFDVPVVFGSDEMQYRFKATKDGNAYSIEGLQLEEKREYPFTLLYDEIDNIESPFALANYFDSIAGLKEQTEIIDLVSGFDKRSSRFQTAKQTFTLGKMPLRDEELEYLIAFFRCVKGKAMRWKLQRYEKILPMRFGDDTLTLRLNKQKRYEVDSLRVIEVFEPLPVEPIPKGINDYFVESQLEYQVFFSIDEPDQGQEQSSYPSPIFVDRLYPYLSVFINNNRDLISTYNGTQKNLGTIAFSSFTAVNLNYRENGEFTGSGLSGVKDMLIGFRNSGVTFVKNIDPTNRSIILKGNIAWDEKIYSLSPQYTQNNNPEIFSRIRNNFSSGIDYALTGSSFNSNAFSGDSFQYADVIEADNGTGYTELKINLSFTPSGEYVTYANNVTTVPSSGTGSLGFVKTRDDTHTWDWSGDIFVENSDGQNLKATKQIGGTDTYRENIELQDTTTAESFKEEQGQQYVNINLKSTGSYSLSRVSSTVEFEYKSNPVIVSDYFTKVTIDNKDITRNSNYEFTAARSNMNYQTTVYNEKQIDNQSALSTFKIHRYTSILNIGDLGIWREYKSEYTNRTTNLTDASGVASVYGDYVALEGTPPPSSGYIRVSTVRVTAQLISQGYSQRDTTELRFQVDNDFYKIGYLSFEITAKPGYADYCSFSSSEASKVNDFYLSKGTTESSIKIILTNPYKQFLNLPSIRETEGDRPPFGTYTTTQDITRVSLNPKDIRGAELENEILIFKTSWGGQLYLALCRVTSLVATETDYGNTNNQPDTRTITQLNAQILSVQTIKSFFTTSNFLFTANGCAIARFLDPYKSSVIRENGKTFLTSTMTVSQYNTQTLVFQLVSNGLEFYGVFGGDVSNLGSSPGAENYITYFGGVT